MPNDAKLGLFLGVALVILIAVVFFRRDAAQVKSSESTSAAVKPGTVPVPGARHGCHRAARNSREPRSDSPPGPAALPHSTRVVEFFDANREVQQDAGATWE